MRREEIESILKHIIGDLLNIAELSIQDDSNFITDFQTDSFDGVEMIMGVEDEFNISISDDEADMVFIFKALVDLVDRKIN